MIRRDAPQAFDLIAQHDHALLAGFMARHIGNARFAPPEPFHNTIRGIDLHDSGWPLHDDHPTLDANGHPLDVFQTPPEIALTVWAASADRAAAQDPYAGLLVSLHVLALSRLSSQPRPAVPPATPHHTPQQLFAINRFQHAQIELQENLRHRLDLATDEPLHFGLAEQSSDPRERQLARNFHLLQAMDQLSLAICCTTPPVTLSVLISPTLGAAPVQLSLRRAGNDLVVNPWPFDAATLPCQVPYRGVPDRAYAGNEEFQKVYSAATVRTLCCALRPG